MKRSYEMPAGTDPNQYLMVPYIKGRATCQSKNIVESFKILEQEIAEPVNIIEIGTNHGGFTLFLNDLKFEKKVHSFDIHKLALHGEELLEQEGVRFYKMDALKKGRPIIETILKEPKKCLLFCDGGNKVLEFKTFGPLLKVGDLIFAHDYFRTPQDLDETIWKWCETTEADLKETCEKANLEPYHQDAFAKSVWAARIRTKI